MSLPPPVTWVSLVAGAACLLSVLLYATIFRHPYELRKARAFLAYREYERILKALGGALALASLVLLVALSTNPGIIDLHDFFGYAMIQFFLCMGMLYHFSLSRKSGKK